MTCAAAQRHFSACVGNLLGCTHDHGCFDAQEGSADGAHSALANFQSLVSNQLAKMEKDFKSGSPFPELPMIMDHKAFQVLLSQTLSTLSSGMPSSVRSMQAGNASTMTKNEPQSGRSLYSAPFSPTVLKISTWAKLASLVRAWPHPTLQHLHQLAFRFCGR